MGGQICLQFAVITFSLTPLPDLLIFCLWVLLLILLNSSADTANLALKPQHWCKKLAIPLAVMLFLTEGLILHVKVVLICIKPVNDGVFHARHDHWEIMN